MALINLRRTINSPVFSQNIVVTRTEDTWEGGRVEKTETIFKMSAIVNNIKESELNQLPEGDFSTGVMVFKTSEPLYKTNSSGTSDTILWNNKNYRIIADADASGYGFYKSYGAYIAS